MNQTSDQPNQEQKQEILAITNVLVERRHKTGDQYEWYKALFFTALEEYKDWRKAIKVADRMFAKQPTMPPGLADSPVVSPEAAQTIIDQFPPEFFGGGAGAG